MARSTTLQSKAGYIDARPLTANLAKSTCNARPDHTLGLGCVKTPRSNLRVEISSPHFIHFKTNSAKDRCWEQTIEKTILRLPRARTFLHSLGHSLPSEAVDFDSASNSTPDKSLHRTNRRAGPRPEVRGAPRSMLGCMSARSVGNPLSAEMWLTMLMRSPGGKPDISLHRSEMARGLTWMASGGATTPAA
jgi:hypothetical protein